MYCDGGQKVLVRGESAKVRQTPDKKRGCVRRGSNTMSAIGGQEDGALTPPENQFGGSELIVG